MKESLDQAQRIARSDPHLQAFDIHITGNELRLAKGGESFARLFQTEKEGYWRMEYFHNREKWEHIDFVGTLEECLEFLSGNPHYLFWEG
ncbi:MAG: hypothetical protein R2940_07990 [Syntrophotaleaceae bacterium]